MNVGFCQMLFLCLLGITAMICILSFVNVLYHINL